MYSEDFQTQVQNYLAQAEARVETEYNNMLEQMDAEGIKNNARERAAELLDTIFGLLE